MFDLEQSDFADDGVVNVHSNVQSHLGRKLHQQLLFICTGNVTKLSMCMSCTRDDDRGNC